MGETVPSGVPKSPAVTSGSEKQGSEQASSLVAAHPIDQSKVSGCDTNIYKILACTTADTTFCIRVCQQGLLQFAML